MVAALFYLAIAQYINFISVSYGRKSMGYDYDSFILEKIIYFFKNSGFGNSVNRSGRFVKNDDRRISVKKSGNSYFLPLTGAWPDSPRRIFR